MKILENRPIMLWRLFDLFIAHALNELGWCKNSASIHVNLCLPIAHTKFVPHLELKADYSNNLVNE